MNAIELRYEIYKFLVGLLTAGVSTAALESPVPGQPPVIKVACDDPYGGPTRFYRLKIEEVAD